jgi:hypothetical protein
MSFPGPLQVSPINPTADQELGLRSFQRVTAQVLSVTGTTAVLSIEGHAVVAQLTSTDQAAILLSQRTAQFIVTQLTDQVVTLKFVKNEQPQSSLNGNVANGPELAMRLLEQNNIPNTVTNLMMARSLLKQNLPVTSRLLNEMLDTLSEYGVWGEADAELAAAMKAAGLPVTAQSLKLMSQQSVQTGEALSNLITTLSQSAKQDLPAEILKQINQNLQILNTVILKGDEESSQLAEQLKASVKLLGRSLENILLEQSQNPKDLVPEKSLVTLLRLQQTLEQFGQKESGRTVNKFLADILQNQFINIKPDPIPGRGAWTEIGFMIQSAQQKANEKFSSARLRIAHESKADSDKINPAYTRIILQVDLDSGNTVEVDLSLVGKQIRTSVMAPDPIWCEKAQRELPSLAEGLQALGYNLKDTQIGVGTPQLFEGIKTAFSGAPLMTVNIEV